MPFLNVANTIRFVGSAGVVACITDFGSSDYYAGALRGVLSSLVPGAPVVDITHEVPAGDIRRAAILLWEAQPSFPDGTVFLVVVDPGVGSARRPAAFRFPRCSLVCPDNGTATFLLERHPELDAVEIDPRRVRPDPASSTFHGRDLFAPAAAMLFRGQEWLRLGPALVDPVKLPLPLLRGEPGSGLDGEVLYIDHFGNAVTSIGAIAFDGNAFKPWLRGTGAIPGTIPAQAGVVLSNGAVIPLRRTYLDAKDESGPIALIGGNGLLEIASWNAPAGASAAFQPGAVVRLKPIS
ncbi:MAG: SAM-dependent chlorinase/fluorinase [Anaerolineales bacterium]|nr:SAM-dependent chlorinase/fluorinase [Anaerolineales bacterium]